MSLDEIIIRQAWSALDRLVGECVGIDGKPIAPSYKAILEARKLLPDWCEYTLVGNLRFEHKKQEEERRQKLATTNTTS